MTRVTPNRTARTAALLALLAMTLVTIGCRDSVTEPMPVMGALHVSVSTSGTDFDPDGYILSLDLRESRAIPVNGTVTFSGLVSGAHDISIAGLRSGCIVDGPGARSILVIPGQYTSITLPIVCGPPWAAGFTCSAPAPLGGRFDPRAPAYLVQYWDTVDPVVQTQLLALKYGFVTRSVWQYALKGFSALLTDEMVNGIRCEPSVKRVEHDAVMSLPRPAKITF